MIKSIELSGFQAHQSLLLEFDPGVNALVGNSDSGKSAIYRALQWVVSNRPVQTDGLKTWYGEMVSVTITTDDHVVTRKRTKTKNLYIVDGVELKSFGTGVPQEVVDALNLKGINFSPQRAAPFLLSDSPVEVARKINEFANLGIIGTSQSNVAGKVRRLTMDINREEESLEQARKELESMPDMSGVLAMVEVLRGLENNRTNAREMAQRIREALSSLEGARGGIERTPDLSGALPRIKELETKIQAHKGLLRRVRDLECELSGLDKYTKQAKEAEVAVEQALDTLNREMPEVCPLCEQPIKSRMP